MRTDTLIRHPFRRLLRLRRKEPDLDEIRRRARRLDRVRLTAGGEGAFAFSPDDVLEPDAAPRLFGYYTSEGVDYALRELGIYPRLEEKGLQSPRAEMSGDARRQDLRLLARADGREFMVMEGRFTRSVWRPPEGSPLADCAPDEQNVVFIEWLLLQNPTAAFTSDRPRLPGQNRPGLGLRDEIMSVFAAAARRLDLDAYLANAKLFHNALMYSPLFFFVDPRRQAELEAVREAARGRSLADTALAVEGGFLYEEGRSAPYAWEGALMIRPLSARLLQAYHDCGYARAVEEAGRGMTFRFDWAGFDRNRAAVEEKVLGPADGRGERLTE